MTGAQLHRLMAYEVAIARMWRRAEDLHRASLHRASLHRLPVRGRTQTGTAGLAEEGPGLRGPAGARLAAIRLMVWKVAFLREVCGEREREELTAAAAEAGERLARVSAARERLRARGTEAAA